MCFFVGIVVGGFFGDVGRFTVVASESEQSVVFVNCLESVNV